MERARKAIFASVFEFGSQNNLGMFYFKSDRFKGFEIVHDLGPRYFFLMGH